MLQITWGMQISPGEKKKCTKKVTGKKRRAENETFDMKKTGTHAAKKWWERMRPEKKPVKCHWQWAADTKAERR